MKHLKNFKSIQSTPQINDYVICKEETYCVDDRLANFINNNIGQIAEINKKDGEYPYVIKYENIPDDIFSYFSDILKNNYKYDIRCLRAMDRIEIIHFSKNKEDLETILNANKYNL